MSTNLPTQFRVIRDGPSFDNLVLRALPIDTGPSCTRSVSGACFSRVHPTPVDSPQLVIASKEVFDLLNLPVSLIDTEEFQAERMALVNHLAGIEVWPGSEPAAHCYCGHQFGSFAGQLGDGAVIYLGEIINDRGERWELQLKGAGLTPFSRTADGRKVLRSSLREFLCSEAMYHLGIPTTRAASVITSDTMVPRDVFYTGDTILERASITSRVAATFIRFGSFEITKPRDPDTGRQGPSAGNPTIVKQLTDYVIENFYPEVWSNRDSLDLVAYHLSFFKEVVKRTATLVACWQTVGFCHGVLNTDNMSIIGITMDYGPFGFMDRFMWDHVCNWSDTSGRYSYAQQPSICAWNCARLAECLVRSILDVESSSERMVGVAARRAKQLELSSRFHDILNTNFMDTFHFVYSDRMRKKLGLFARPKTEDDHSKDERLIKSLLDTMEKTGADFTNTFLAIEEALQLAIAQGITGDDGINLCPDPVLEECCSVDELVEAYEPTPADVQMERFAKLAGFSNAYLDRMDEPKVLKKAEKTDRLEKFKHMTDSEKRSHDTELWQTWLNAYAARLLEDIRLEPTYSWLDRLHLMRSSNPRLVLRNYLAEEAIKAAEAGDFTLARQLLDDLRRPFAPLEESTVRTRATHVLPQEHTHSTCSLSSGIRTRVHRPAWARALRIS